MAEPLDKNWRGRAWSDGARVTRVSQPDGTVAEGGAAMQMGWDPVSQTYVPLAIDPVTGALQVAIVSGGSGPPAVPTPGPTKVEALDKHWKGKAWSDGAAVTRVPQSDGTFAEGLAALGYGWDASSGTYSRLPIDHTSGALAVAVVAGQPGAPGPAGPPGQTTASYVFDITGGVVTARAGRAGLSDYSGADGGAVLTSVITALGAGGGLVFFHAGNYPWSSVPKLPAGLTGRIVIAGEGRDATIITLSAAGPRFLDFNRTADYQTFQNIEIRDLTVDCNNVGGRHHVVLGTYVAGVTSQRINITNIAVRRVRTVNVPVDLTTTIHRLNFWLVSSQVTAGEATQNFLTDIVVEDCRFEGGNIGATVGGSGPTDPLGVNVLCDRITFRRCWHSLLTPPASSGATQNYLIGSRGFGGTCLIEDCFGQYSGDVGIEIDAMTDATVRSTIIDDARNQGFFHTNFRPAQHPQKQIVRFDGCVALQANSVGQKAFSFRTANIGGPGVPLGTQIVENCSVYRNAAPLYSTGNFFYRADDGGTLSGLTRTQLIIRNFLVHAEGAADSSAFNSTVSPFVIGPMSVNCISTIRLEDISVYMAGSLTEGASFAIAAVDVYGQNLDFALDGLVVDYTALTGLGVNGARLLHFGTDGVTNLATSAFIRKVRLISPGDGTAGFGVNMSSANLTIPAGRYVFVEDCDFSRYAAIAATSAVSVLAANKSQTLAKGNTWKTAPAPAALAGLVSATGLAVASVWAVYAVFTAGSGAGITAIDVSTNGGTTYTNILTQASGAMPAGPNLVVGPLQSDALIRVTFATTQPTINLVPVRT